MQKQLRHKRFRQTRNQSSTRRHLSLQVSGIIVPKGNEYNDIYKRPDFIHT